MEFVTLSQLKEFIDGLIRDYPDIADLPVGIHLRDEQFMMLEDALFDVRYSLDPEEGMYSDTVDEEQFEKEEFDENYTQEDFTKVIILG